MKTIRKKSVLSYRSLGGSASNEGIGVGFMDKSGISEDNLNFKFPRYVLVVVIQGEGTYIDKNGNEYPLNAGMFFQRFPDVLHSNLVKPDSNWQEYYLEIDGQFFSALQNMNLIKSTLSTGKIKVDAGLESKFERLIKRFQDYRESEQAKLFSNFTSLLMECYERMQPDNITEPVQGIVDMACRFLADDFTRNVDIKSFCQLHGWGYESFRKIFRRQTGISPGQYRIRRRLDYSCELLNNTALSIAEIAEKLAYNSQYEYSAQFKKHFGIAPNFFRH
ncbi:MAG: AraC family transcriptional regulator [Victivallaceae bacterium]|nr:AraC family transcriptional regulator [Victivallaceae bacterium]